MNEKPKIVCLCGSTRFYDAFEAANYRETMKGKIVLSVGFYNHSLDKMHGEYIGCTPEQKIMLDELHKRKIDLSDEVFVLNVGGYIGESTRSEIEYAQKKFIPVRYLEDIISGYEWAENEPEDMVAFSPAEAEARINKAINNRTLDPAQFNSVVVGILGGLENHLGVEVLLEFYRNIFKACYTMSVKPWGKSELFSVELTNGRVLDIQRK